MKTDDFKKDVSLAVKGDAQAFSRLYALVYEEMYRTAFFSLRNEHDAADAVSETVLDAFSSIKKLRREDAFRSWIFKILMAKIERKQQAQERVIKRFKGDNSAQTQYMRERRIIEQIHQVIIDRKDTYYYKKEDKEIIDKICSGYNIKFILKE